MALNLVRPPRTRGPFCSPLFAPEQTPEHGPAKPLNLFLFAPEQTPEHEACSVRVFAPFPF